MAAPHQDKAKQATAQNSKARASQAVCLDVYCEIEYSPRIELLVQHIQALGVELTIYRRAEIPAKLGMQRANVEGSDSTVPMPYVLFPKAKDSIWQQQRSNTKPKDQRLMAIAAYLESNSQKIAADAHFDISNWPARSTDDKVGRLGLRMKQAHQQALIKIPAQTSSERQAIKTTFLGFNTKRLLNQPGISRHSIATVLEKVHFAKQLVRRKSLKNIALASSGVFLIGAIIFHTPSQNEEQTSAALQQMPATKVELQSANKKNELEENATTAKVKKVIVKHVETGSLLANQRLTNKGLTNKWLNSKWLIINWSTSRSYRMGDTYLEHCTPHTQLRNLSPKVPMRAISSTAKAKPPLHHLETTSR